MMLAQVQVSAHSGAAELLMVVAAGLLAAIGIAPHRRGDT
jgi:hypothetical protein